MTPQMDLIGNVVPDTDAWLYEMFDEPCITAGKINEFILANKDAAELKFRISSYGGDLNAAEIAFNMLTSSGKKIIFEIIGQAYSASAILAFSANEIIMYKNTSRMMIHPAIFENVSGNGKQLHEYADYLDSRSNDVFNMILERRPKAKEHEIEVRDAFDSEKELTATECVNLGLADTLIEVVPANIAKFTLLNKSNITDMKVNKKVMDAINAFNTKVDAVLNSLKGNAPKNETATTESGTTVYFNGSLQTGTKMYSDEAMTIPVADGEYKIDDKVYTVSGGAGEITAVADATNASQENTSTEDAAHQEQINNLRTSFNAREKQLNDALRNANENTTKIINDMKTELDKIKGLALDDETPNPEKTGTRVAKDFMTKTLDKMTPKERALKRVADRKKGVNVSTGGY